MFTNRTYNIALLLTEWWKKWLKDPQQQRRQ
jgi:hypothetical protein